MFPIKNIPEYTFHLGIERLRDTIAALFNFSNQYENKYLGPIFYYYIFEENESEKHKNAQFFNAETVKDSLFGRNYFSKPNTSNDIYIHDFNTAWPSKLYFSNGKPLKYRTDFIIKLSKVDLDSTKVVIIAEDPKVLNGIDGFGVHAPVARETAVRPSSIEEYSLLLFIADKLQEHNLLPLKLPSSQ